MICDADADAEVESRDLTPSVRAICHNWGKVAVAAVAVAAILAAASLPRAHAQEAAVTRPNLVVILSDDHRWDYLGSTGHPFIQTPTMDRLSEQGVAFDNAFVTTSLCSPSRASFLTGQYVHSHGVRNNISVWKDENVTVLELLEKEGYDTAFIGKWHMPGRLPNLRGVDRFITFTEQGGQGRYFDCPLIVDGVETPSRTPYITTELTDYALEFIDRPRENPFVLYLAHKAVHHEFLPPPDLAGMYDDEELELPEEADPWVGSTRGFLYSGTLGPISRHMRNYSAAITALDREIGRIVSRLEEMGILDETVIIYTTDNGFFWGEHRLVDKRWPYEESIRIPMIVRYPPLTSGAGRRTPQMVLNIDVAPTLLDLAGAPIPQWMDGQSMVPALESESASGRSAWLYEYFKEFPYNVPEMDAVRTDTHMYIEYATSRVPELYDVVADPRQKHNLTAEPGAKDKLEEMRAALDWLRRKRTD